MVGTMIRRIHTWRYNPTTGDTPWIVGGAVAFIAGLAFLASRTSHAAAPAYVPPAPTPRPQPTTPPADLTFTPEEVRAIGPLLVRQPSTPTLLILQLQLRDLGYAITRTDGLPSDELNRESARYVVTNAVPVGTTPTQLMRLIDAEYARVFAARGYV